MGVFATGALGVSSSTSTAPSGTRRKDHETNVVISFGGRDAHILSPIDDAPLGASFFAHVTANYEVPKNNGYPYATGKDIKDMEDAASSTHGFLKIGEKQKWHDKGVALTDKNFCPHVVRRNRWIPMADDKWNGSNNPLKKAKERVWPNQEQEYSPSVVTIAAKDVTEFVNVLKEWFTIGQNVWPAMKYNFAVICTYGDQEDEQVYLQLVAGLRWGWHTLRGERQVWGAEIKIFRKYLNDPEDTDTQLVKNATTPEDCQQNAETLLIFVEKNMYHAGENVPNDHLVITANAVQNAAAANAGNAAGNAIAVGTGARPKAGARAKWKAAATPSASNTATAWEPSTTASASGSASVTASASTTGWRPKKAGGDMKEHPAMLEAKKLTTEVDVAVKLEEAEQKLAKTKKDYDTQKATHKEIDIPFDNEPFFLAEIEEQEKAVAALKDEAKGESRLWTEASDLGAAISKRDEVQIWALVKKISVWGANVASMRAEEVAGTLSDAKLNVLMMFKGKLKEWTGAEPTSKAYAKITEGTLTTEELEKTVKDVMSIGAKGKEKESKALAVEDDDKSSEASFDEAKYEAELEADFKKQQQIQKERKEAEIKKKKQAIEAAFMAKKEASYKEMNGDIKMGGVTPGSPVKDEILGIAATVEVGEGEGEGETTTASDAADSSTEEPAATSVAKEEDGGSKVVEANDTTKEVKPKAPAMRSAKGPAAKAKTKAMKKATIKADA